MKAAVYEQFGGPDVVQIREVPRPEPRDDEVLIRTRATTVSAGDYRARSRDIPAGLALMSSFVLGFRRPKRPVLGTDVAGVVEAVGPRATAFHPGDEVIAMLGWRFGGHAEFAIADKKSVVAAKPPALSWDDAGALVFGGINAIAFLDQLKLASGSHVLINGGSGAVGSAAVQVAKIADAHVTAVTSTANVGLVTDLGADRVIDYTQVNFLTETIRYDVVMDCVGNAPLSKLSTVVKRGGTVLLVAASLRSMVSAAWQSRIHGITVVTGPGRYLPSQLDRLAQWTQDGRVRPVIDRTIPFERITDAHRVVDSGRKRGNVVVTIE
jgi:NADPH:quinone reductase-like Zn-dependent oxidoreductase